MSHFVRIEDFAMKIEIIMSEINDKLEEKVKVKQFKNCIKSIEDRMSQTNNNVNAQFDKICTNYNALDSEVI